MRFLVVTREDERFVEGINYVSIVRLGRSNFV